MRGTEPDLLVDCASLYLPSRAQPSKLITDVNTPESLSLFFTRAAGIVMMRPPRGRIIVIVGALSGFAGIAPHRPSSGSPFDASTSPRAGGPALGPTNGSSTFETPSAHRRGTLARPLRRADTSLLIPAISLASGLKPTSRVGIDRV